MAYPTYFTPQQSYMPQQYSAMAPLQASAQMPPIQPVSTGTISQPIAPQGFACHPVTAKAQAEMFQIPFDGSTTYFVDTSNGNLYSKTFDIATGKAPLVTYVREAEQVIQYATLDDLKELREELMKRPVRAVRRGERTESDE